MAATLPSPPVSRSSTPDGMDHDQDHDALTQRLDGLLEQYLNLLDQYTALREDLSKSFSSGFFSLAHAQRASTLGPGRRYGQECYDERMKAQRRVEIADYEKTKEHGVAYRVIKRTAPVVKNEDTSPRTAQHEGNPGGDEKDEIWSEDAKGENRGGLKAIENSPKQRRKQDPATRDAITWFGLLAPPALRQCQSQFIRAVETQVPHLLSVEAEMKRVEEQVGTLRERLALMHEYEDQHADVKAEEREEVAGMMKGQAMQPVEAQVSKSQVSRRQLAARPAHSKSHLLKLGE